MEHLILSSQPSKKSKELFRQGVEAEARHDFLLALAKFTESLENTHHDISAWINIGRIQMQIQKYQQAAETFNFIISLDANNSTALCLLASCYFHLARLDEALVIAEQAYQLAPNSDFVHDAYAYILCAVKPDPKTRFDIYKAWGEKFADPLILGQPKLTVDKNPLRKLKIGYVSGDMRQHSMAFFIQPVFAHHNPNNVDVYVFSTSASKDSTTDNLKSLVPNWLDVSKLTDLEILRLIRKNKIDILIDLSGHTAGNRLFVFARRAAPIQITWMGFLGTIGMKAIDYRFTDDVSDPLGAEQWYVEKLFRLECMASYSPPSESPIALEPPQLTQKSPTLVSLNASKKITDEILITWKKILLARPDATLIIHVTDRSIDEAIKTMLTKLEELELPLDQISISPQVPLKEFMERGLVADIALDTSPISGGTTTFHALWMGLPVITINADNAVSSSTTRVLEGFGLSEWVAKDENDYIEITLNLMDDIARLRQHRAEIRNIMQQSPFMNYEIRCAELEKAFKLMWFNYLTNEKTYLHTKFDINHEYTNLIRKI